MMDDGCVTRSGWLVVCSFANVDVLMVFSRHQRQQRDEMRLYQIEKMRQAESKYEDDLAHRRREVESKIKTQLRHEEDDEHSLFEKLKRMARDFAIHGYVVSTLRRGRVMWGRG